MRIVHENIRMNWNNTKKNDNNKKIKPLEIKNAKRTREQNGNKREKDFDQIYKIVRGAQ